MKLSDAFVNVWSSRVLSVLRIVAGFMFMSHGMQKILGFPVPRPASFQLLSLSGTAGVLELIGGILLLLGLFTRPVAFILSGEMAFAYFLAHAPHGFLPLVNRGELAVLYCFVFLYLAVAGGGMWSIDHWWHSRRIAPGEASRWRLDARGAWRAAIAMLSLPAISRWSSSRSRASSSVAPRSKLRSSVQCPRIPPLPVQR
jgi:putative oxidoreductase